MDLKDTAVVTTPDGRRTEVPAQWLTREQATLLREYAALLAPMGLRATLVCGHCGEEAECYVQDDIGIFCSCRVRLWKPS